MKWVWFENGEQQDKNNVRRVADSPAVTRSQPRSQGFSIRKWEEREKGEGLGSNPG